MESFWKHLKMSLFITNVMKPGNRLITEITEYIEIFYNRHRRQERIGFLSPFAYERQFYEKQLAA